MKHEIVQNPKFEENKIQPPEILEVTQEEVDKMLREDMIKTSENYSCIRSVIVKKY